MSDAVPADGRTGAGPAGDRTHAVARELLGILPFGARPEALARCPSLVGRLHAARYGVTAGPAIADPEDAGSAAAAVVAAVEAAIEDVGPVRLRRHPDPLPAALARRMLHVLLATRDLGWPGTDAPLSVRRVAAADLFFDATQTVLADDDWKGPHGVEFALLTALAGRLRHAPRPGPAGPGDDPGVERLGHLRRVQRPHGS